jgi:hypothetical protein
VAKRSETFSFATVERFHLSDRQGRARRADIFSYWLLSSWPLSSSANSKQGKAARQKDLGNFRIWFSGHGFQDLGSQLWDLGNFGIWFSGHGFQDLGFQLWGLDFHTRGFQDRNLKTFRT